MAISDEQFAAAMMAKLAGSTLKEIDDNTTQQGGSTGPALRLDPLSFISTAQNSKVNQQQRLIDEANRLAEQLHPLPPPVAAPQAPPSTPAPLFNDLNVPKVQETVHTATASPELIEVLKNISNSLDRFVTVYEKSVKND